MLSVEHGCDTVQPASAAFGSQSWTSPFVVLHCGSQIETFPPFDRRMQHASPAQSALLAQASTESSAPPSAWPHWALHAYSVPPEPL